MPDCPDLATDAGSLSFLLDDRSADRRALRLGLAAATVLHAVLFAITWPAVAPRPSAERAEPTVIRLQPLPRFVEPPPREQVLRQPQIRRVPVPDLTPFDAEPEVDTAAPPTMELPPDLVLGEVSIPPLPAPAPAVVEVGLDIAPPVRLAGVQPRYPEMARRSGVQGAVVLQLLIDPNGVVTEAAVLRGQPMGLTEAALEAVRQWRFEPSRVNQRPVSVIYRLTVHFDLAR